jgi:hypothetical protein
MCHWESKSAHVALQPPCTDAALRAFGLPPQTEILLAWEATHAARLTLCSNYADHPEWFIDGFAHSVAGAATTAADGGKRADEALPFWSTGMLRVQRLQSARKLPPSRAIVADEIDDLELPERYATRGQFFAFLQATAPDRLKTLATKIRGTGGGGNFRKTIAAEAKKLGDLDKAFEKYLAAQRPEWEEVFRSLAPTAEGLVQVAFPDKNAIAWASQTIAGPFAAQGKLRILPGGHQQLNFLFGRSDTGFWSIAFVADRGFTVLRYEQATNEWRSLSDGNAPALRVGVATAIAIRGAGRELKVEIDGQSWQVKLDAELPKALIWGLGAQAGPDGAAEGSAGIWQDWRVVDAK